MGNDKSTSTVRMNTRVNDSDSVYVEFQLVPISEEHARKNCPFSVHGEQHPTSMRKAIHTVVESISTKSKFYPIKGENNIIQ